MQVSKSGQGLEILEVEVGVTNLLTLCRNILFAIILFITLITGIQIAMSLVLMVFNPIRRSQSAVRSHVLMLMPIGMNMEDAIAIIENYQHWGTPTIRYNSGFSRPMGHGYPVSRLESASHIGEKSIRIRVAYRPSSTPILGLILETRVRIDWGFDAEGKLIEVFVWRTYSA